MTTLNTDTAVPVILNGTIQTYTVALQAGVQYRIDLPGTGSTAADAAYAATLKIFPAGGARTTTTGLNNAVTLDTSLGTLSATTATKGTLYFTPISTGAYDLDLTASAGGTYALDVLTPTLPQNSIVGPAYSPTNTLLAGTAGNDVIQLGSFATYRFGNAPAQPTNIDGGKGFDTLVVTNQDKQFDTTAVQADANGFYINGSFNPTIYFTSTPHAIDYYFTNARLTSVEAVEFYNTTVFTLDAAHANVARLYEAALGRAPDIAGLAFQLGRFDSGDSLQQIAHNFLASPEYNSVARPAAVETFITTLYQNALGRAPEAAGLNFYASAMARGDMSAEAVLIGIADSPESQQHNGQVVYQA